MSIQTWLSKILQPYLKPIVNPYWTTNQTGKARPSDYDAMVKRFRSWVYVCASRNAQAVAQVPLRLYAQGTTQRFPSKTVERKHKSYLAQVSRKAVAPEVQEITEHPILELMDHVNPKMTGNELLEKTVLYEELTGNAYWYIVDNPALARPMEIWPLMSQYVTIVPDEQDYLKGYLYGTDSRSRKAFAPEEVIHLSYPSVEDYWYGMGPLQAALLAVDRSTAMAEYHTNFFDNSARPDILLKSEQDIPADTKKAFLKEWDAKFRGKQRSWRPAFLTGGVDLEVIAYPPSDTGLIEAGKFSREEICDIFGVPLSFIEISAARAEAEAHQYVYAQYTLLPRLTRMAEKLTEELCARYDPRLFLAFDNPVPESVEARLREIESHLMTGYSTINLERAEDGQDAVDWGDVVYLPNNLKPIDQVLNPPQPPPNPFALGPAPRPDEPEKSKAILHSVACTCSTCKGVLPEMTDGEKQLAGVMEKAFAKQYKDVMRRLEESK